MASKYLIYMINITLINIIAITGFNLLTGYTGQISMGNAAFLGIGGFITAILSTNFGFPFWLSIPFGGLTAMLIGILIGVPALRLKGIYLLLATLALHFITGFFLLFYQVKSSHLGGLQFPKMQIGDFVFDTQIKSYYLFLVITAIVMGFVYNLLRTDLGRSFLATRDNEVAARAMGVNVTYTKLVAFALSSFLIGIAGGLMGFALSNLTAEIFSMDLVVDHLMALFLGGQATLFGPVLGSAFITLFPEAIRALTNATKDVPLVGTFMDANGFQVMNFIYGLSIVLILIFKPVGLVGVVNDLYLYVRRKMRKDINDGPDIEQPPDRDKSPVRGEYHA